MASKLGNAIAGALALVAATFVALGTTEAVVLLAVAVPFAASAGLLWYHASGRLAAASPRTGRRRADGRRERAAAAHERTATSSRRRRAAATGRATGRTRGRETGGRETNGRGTDDRRTAYRVLGLDPGADESAVRRAYRERAKETHPDRGGDAETFKRVQRAYELLSD